MRSLCKSQIIVIIVLLFGQLTSSNFFISAAHDDDFEVVDLENSYQSEYTKCCNIGKKQATNKGYCSGSNKVNECKSLSELCCLEQLSLKECQSGVKFVTRTHKNGHSEDVDCIRANSFRESFEYRCCSACRMGFMAAENRLGGKRKWCSSEWIQSAVQNLSTFSSLVTTHIETSYVQCCNHGMTLNSDLLQNDHKENNKLVAAHTVDARSASTTFCKEGFKYNKDTGKCMDIDECTTGQNDCHKSNLFCVNKVGTYSCSRCKAGFAFDEQLAVCRDVNECDQQPYPCKAGQSCRNLVGSFKCFCQVGYEMDNETHFCRDINECQLGTHNCHESLRCDNTIGSFHCVRVQDCGTGYTINADQDVCEDVNECILGTHDCPSPDYQCRNTQGSFKCEPVRVQCPLGKQLNLDTGACEEECPFGQRYNSRLGQCLPTNYCFSNPCKAFETCINKDTGYECNLLCPPGYFYNLTSKSCSDINECTTGAFECGPNQECVNLAGHYDCACLKGYQMDSTRTCIDVNECITEWWNCQHPFKCTNTIGSYSCSECQSGYKLNISSGQCEDVDECLSNGYSHPSICDQMCFNTAGSYKCHCRQGFKLDKDGRTCVDIDECQLMKSANLQTTEFVLPNIKVCKGTCVNKVGSFECKCPNGFRTYKEQCFDINECLENTRLCSSNKESLCVNTFGGYECEIIKCPIGYNKTTTNKSVQCLFDESQPSLFDTVHKINYLFYSMYSNQTVQFSRSSTYTFYATRYNPEEQNSSYSSKYGTYFDLQLISASPTIYQHDYFLLTKRRQNEATISLLKPLAGPQVVKLELSIIGYKKYNYYRQKVVFTINISKYGSM